MMLLLLVLPLIMMMMMMMLLLLLLPLLMMMMMIMSLDGMSVGDGGREAPTCNWSDFSPLCALSSFHHCDLDERDLDDRDLDYRDLDDRDLDDRDDWDDRTTEAPPSSNFISPVFFPQH